LLWWLASRRRRRARAIERLFDIAIEQTPTPAAQVAVMSELLRRAARRHNAQADRLQDAAWLELLEDGASTPQFLDTDAGRLLLEGPFRNDVDALAVEHLRQLARRRFVALMSPGRQKRRRPTPLPGAVNAAVLAADTSPNSPA